MTSNPNAPASAVAIIIGLLLVTVGSVGLALLPGENDYQLTWSQESGPRVDVALAAAGADAEISMDVTDAIRAGLQVEMTQCADNRNPQLHQAAVITYTITRSAMVDGQEVVENIASTSGTCAQLATPAIVGEMDEPDGTATALSAAEAIQGVYAEHEEDATYTLTASWTRAAGTSPIGIPGQGPTFSGAFAMTYLSWNGTASLQEEVLR